MDDFVSQNENSQDLRKHSLNDAVAIPGVYPFAYGGETSHPDSVCIKMGSAEVWLNEGELSGSVGGTSFSFSGGDLVVNGISHCHHTPRLPRRFHRTTTVNEVIRWHLTLL
jgi:hypothetical protein